MLERFLHNAATFATSVSNSLTQARLIFEATRLEWQARKQYQTSQFTASLQSSQQALAIYRKIGYRPWEGQILVWVGEAYRNLGQYPQALEFYQQAFDVLREERQRRELFRQRFGIVKQPGNYDAIDGLEGLLLSNIGVVYDNLGQYTQALESYQQALDIFRELDKDPFFSQANKSFNSLNRLQIGRTPRACEGTILNNIGRIYENLGQYPQALESLQEALAIVREVGDHAGEGTPLNSIGFVYMALGQPSEALKYYQQALDIYKKVGDRQGEGLSLNSIGSVYMDLGQPSQAMECYQQALDIFKKVGDRANEAVTLTNIGNTLPQIDNFAEAEKNLFAAVEIRESLRPGLKDTDKVSIFETQANSYHLLQLVLIAQNKSEDALEISERGRARAFVELLAERLFPQSSVISTLNPPNLTQIRQIAQEQNSTLVEYSIVNSNKVLPVWVIKPTGETAFCSVDLSLLEQRSTSLADLVTQARESLGVEETLRDATQTITQETPQPIRYINEPLRQLHQYLIEPIANLLPSDPNAHVIFIPQGELFLVPFPALQDATGKFLIEQHTILTAPSIQTLELTRKQRQRVETIHESPLQGEDVLVVGNPTMPTIPLKEPLKPLDPLPGSEAEAKAIASLLNTQPIIGDAATKVDIVQRIPKARLIHLATHGLLDDIKQLGVPGAIALAPSDNDNGFLTAGEILEMKLNAELIVLSACSSGQGKITGDGVIGLSRSLFAAGVPSVIVSLWSVGDKSTQFLMTEFYQNLQHGMNKAQSLRQAMLTTMQRYRRPKSWAAFTLIGEAI